MMETGTEIRPDDADPVAAGSVATMVPQWLRRAAAVADEYDLTSIRTALGALSTGRSRPTMRLVVAGESGRGTSTLIYRVLGASVLPTDDGRAPAVIGTGRGDQVSHPWLAEQRVELVDMPGVRCDADIDLLRDKVADCDGVLLVVSAIAPLSMTEMRLLEEALAHHLPFVAVVVTMLDLVDEADWDDILGYVESRVGDRSGVDMVLAGPGTDSHDANRIRLREVITGLASNPHWLLARGRCIAAQVADHCVAMASHAAEEIVERQRRDQERQAEAERLMGLMELQSQDWAMLRVQLSTRQIALAGTLRESLRQERLAVIEKLRSELERAQDPRKWWEYGLTASLRTALSTLVGRTERMILAGLASDTAWLTAEVGRMLAAAPPGPPPPKLAMRFTADVPSSSGYVRDLTRTRLATRAGAQGSAIIGYLVAQGFHQSNQRQIYGVAFSVIGGLLAEISIRAATERQRHEVDRLLLRAVNEALTGFATQAVAVQASSYQPVFEYLRTSHLTWQQERLAGLNDGTGVDNHWQALARDATELAVTIQAALSAESKGAEE